MRGSGRGVQGVEGAGDLAVAGGRVRAALQACTERLGASTPRGATGSLVPSCATELPGDRRRPGFPLPSQPQSLVSAQRLGQGLPGTGALRSV